MLKRRGSSTPAPYPDTGAARRTQCSGMTLLELVIAIAVFSLVTAAAYAALSQGLTLQDRLQEQRRFWQRFDTVFNLVNTDLEQAVDLASRTTRNNTFNGYQQADTAVSGHILEFTRNADTTFHTGPASPFLRVAYRVHDGGLYRRIWSRLDRPYGIEPAESLLIEGVRNIRLRYLSSAGGWLTHWPQAQYMDESSGLPRAVEVIVEVEDRGAYRWLFHVGPPH